MTLRIAVLALAIASSASAQFNCSASTYGAGCGPVMTFQFAPQGNGGNRNFDITCAGLQPGVIGVMAWGVQPINALLGGGCTLYTDYVWGHTFQTGPLGDFSWSRTWPAGAMPSTYYIQFGSVEFLSDGSLNLRASNAMRAACL